MRLLARLRPAFLVLLVGCTAFPQLDAVISEQAKRAEYPVLIPTGGLLAKRDDGQVTEETGQRLLARAANLRRRAALLRGAPIDEETRIRLRDRLRRLGG
jgi:hypothetical protein